MADHPEQGVPHVAHCAACSREIGTFKAEGHELCNDCESDRLMELADVFDEDLAADNDDGQPTEAQEWADYDADC